MSISFLICFFSVKSAEAQDVQPLPIKASLEVYPKEIYYGDILFNRVKVQNESKEDIVITIKDTGRGLRVLLKRNKMPVYTWLNFMAMTDQEYYFVHIFGEVARIFSLHPFCVIPANTTDKVLLRPLWLPMYEFSDTKELKTAISSGPKQYQIEFVDQLVVLTRNPSDQEHPYLPVAEENRPDAVYITGDVTVKPRPQGDFDLLQEWFLELPTTKSDIWTEDAVFVYSFYARDSPLQTKVHSLKESQEKREPFSEKMDEFYKSVETRTPELLARIDRTNELAAKIIERSKEPDSTFSQNMVEFIQLRGFLVDMRYAEDLEAEEIAFQKLMGFVDKSQDKELWIDFIYDVGLDSIVHHTYFPYAKAFEYRERFAERMQMRNRCHSTDDFDRIYDFRKKEKKQSE